MENTEKNTSLYAVGFAGTIDGNKSVSEEYAGFYEHESKGGSGEPNIYVLASGEKGGYQSEAAARFTVKKTLYEFSKNDDPSDSNRLAMAMRAANNELYDYGKVQEEVLRTAVLGTVVTNGKLVVGKVGSCHAYIIRNGKAFEITEDADPYDEANGIETPLSNVLGEERDIVVDIYDGIDLHAGDVLLLCSKSVDTFFGKQEILDAALENSPREIVEHLLKIPGETGRPVAASVIAIKICDENTLNTVMRYDGPALENTDLNTEAKDISLQQTTRSRISRPSSKKKADKLPLYIIGVLLGLLLLGGVVYGTKTNKLGALFPPRATATPTIDFVAETVAVIQSQLENERDMSVAQTVAAIPTQTPYPTYTPETIDMDLIRTQAAEDYMREFGAEALSAGAPEAAAVSSENSPAISRENLVSKSGSEMIYIPAGSFLLGMKPEESSSDDNFPQLSVNLSAYWIDKTEVTNAQYRACVDAGVCYPGSYSSIYTPGMEDYPVTYITVDEAQTYCKWIDGRLPSEFEWEKAARGSDDRLYPWGNETPSLTNDLANIPNYVNADGQGYDLFPVGSFPKGVSPYGLLDMAGNVWEWTGTYYSANAYSSLEAESEVSGAEIKDPTGPEDGSAYVIRGGSCSTTESNYYDTYLTVTNRGYVNISSGYYIGFRCVVEDK